MDRRICVRIYPPNVKTPHRKLQARTQEIGHLVTIPTKEMDKFESHYIIIYVHVFIHHKLQLPAENCWSYSLETYADRQTILL